MGKIYYLCLLIFILYCQSPTKASSLIDSLQSELSKTKIDTSKANLYIELGKASMSSGEFDKTIEYCNKALSISEKSNFVRGKSNAYHIMGIVYTNQSQYQLALKYNYEALKLREEMGDKKGIAGTSNNIGIIYMNQSNYAPSLNMFFKALKINEELKNLEWAAGNYNNIGIIYLIQKQYPEALKYFREVLETYIALDDRPSQNHPYNNIGNVYFEQGKYSEALQNYKVALEIRKEMGDLIEVSNSLINIGVCQEMLGNYDEALNYHFESLKIANEINHLDGKSSIFNNIASVKVKQRKYTEAKLYYNKALLVTNEIGSMEGIMNYHEGMTDVDSALGDYKSSLNHYKLYVQYRDSLVNDDNKKAIVQQQMQYDFDKKEAATQAEQDIKDAVAQKELQKQKLVRNGFVGGFAIVLLFAGVFFTQRNKIKLGKKLSDELLLNILPSEVAEELKAKGSADARQFSDVTVMFTDFKGFTTISENLTPSELVAEIDTCFKAFDHIITKHNIEKIKTIGDSYMCAGGLPVANTTNANDVVSAAIEIQQFMLAHLNSRKIQGKPLFEIRIGVHTGPVVAGIVGIKKFAYDIWGDTVNIASRMESSGEAGKVNISGSTYELVKNKFNCIHRGKIQAKNKGEIDMYFVTRSFSEG